MHYSQVKALILRAKAGDRFDRSEFTGYKSPILAFLRRYDESYDYCDHCDTFSTQDHTDAEGGVVCQDCLDENFYYCPHCEEYTSNGLTEVTLRSGRTEHWCEDCVGRDTFTCYECDTVHADNCERYEYNGDPLCESCYDSGFFTCERCDEVYRNEDYGEDGECQECCGTRERNERGRVIQSYSTKAQRELAWGKPEPRGKFTPVRLYFGAELEVQVPSGSQSGRNEVAGEFIEEFRDEVILCEDGSLGDGGFEIKTPPLAMSAMVGLMGRIADNGVSRQLRSHDGGACGLHIHITRSALSPLQQGKLYEFINKKENRPLIRALARRYTVVGSDEGRGGYCRMYPGTLRKDINLAWKGMYEHHKLSAKEKCQCTKQRGVNSERYSAVNFTYETVELRFFRGTLKRTTLLACLEFAWALVYYTRTGACKNTELTQAEFLDWVKTCPFRMKHMGHLCRFLVAKGLLPESALPRKKPEEPQLEAFPLPALADPDSLEEDEPELEAA